MAKHKPNLLTRATEAMGITHAEPEVTIPAVPTLSERAAMSAPPAPDRRFWPAGVPLPTEYRKARRNTLPCPKCRRVLLDDGGQAVVCTSSGSGVAFFRCKACGERWKLGVKEV